MSSCSFVVEAFSSHFHEGQENEQKSEIFTQSCDSRCWCFLETATQIASLTMKTKRLSNTGGMSSFGFPYPASKQVSLLKWQKVPLADPRASCPLGFTAVRSGA